MSSIRPTDSSPVVALKAICTGLKDEKEHESASQKASNYLKDVKLDSEKVSHFFKCISARTEWLDAEAFLLLGDAMPARVFVDAIRMDPARLQYIIREYGADGFAFLYRKFLESDNRDTLNDLMYSLILKAMYGEIDEPKLSDILAAAHPQILVDVLPMLGSRGKSIFFHIVENGDYKSLLTIFNIDIIHRARLVDAAFNMSAMAEVTFDGSLAGNKRLKDEERVALTELYFQHEFVDGPLKHFKSRKTREQFIEVMNTAFAVYLPNAGLRNEWLKIINPVMQFLEKQKKLPKSDRDILDKLHYMCGLIHFMNYQDGLKIPKEKKSKDSSKIKQYEEAKRFLALSSKTLTEHDEKQAGKFKLKLEKAQRQTTDPAEVKRIEKEMQEHKRSTTRLLQQLDRELVTAQFHLEVEKFSPMPEEYSKAIAHWVAMQSIDCVDRDTHLIMGMEFLGLGLTERASMHFLIANQLGHPEAKEFLKPLTLPHQDPIEHLTELSLFSKDQKSHAGKNTHVQVHLPNLKVVSIGKDRYQRLENLKVISITKFKHLLENLNIQLSYINERKLSSGKTSFSKIKDKLRLLSEILKDENQFENNSTVILDTIAYLIKHLKKLKKNQTAEKHADHMLDLLERFVADCVVSRSIDPTRQMIEYHLTHVCTSLQILKDLYKKLQDIMARKQDAIIARKKANSSDATIDDKTDEIFNQEKYTDAVDLSVKLFGPLFKLDPEMVYKVLNEILPTLDAAVAKVNLSKTAETTTELLDCIVAAFGQVRAVYEKLDERSNASLEEVDFNSSILRELDKMSAIMQEIVLLCMPMSPKQGPSLR